MGWRERSLEMTTKGPVNTLAIYTTDVMFNLLPLFKDFFTAHDTLYQYTPKQIEERWQEQDDRTLCTFSDLEFMRAFGGAYTIDELIPFLHRHFSDHFNDEFHRDTFLAKIRQFNITPLVTTTFQNIMLINAQGTVRAQLHERLFKFYQYHPLPEGNRTYAFANKGHAQPITTRAFHRHYVPRIAELIEPLGYTIATKATGPALDDFALIKRYDLPTDHLRITLKNDYR